MLSYESNTISVERNSMMRSIFLCIIITDYTLKDYTIGVPSSFEQMYSIAINMIANRIVFIIITNFA